MLQGQALLLNIIKAKESSPRLSRLALFMLFGI
jgi:hypothetical protein